MCGISLVGRSVCLGWAAVALAVFTLGQSASCDCYCYLARSFPALQLLLSCCLLLPSYAQGYSCHELTKHTFVPRSVPTASTKPVPDEEMSRFEMTMPGGDSAGQEIQQGTVSKYFTGNAGFVKSDLFEGELGFKTEKVMLGIQNDKFKVEQSVEFDADGRGRPHAVARKLVAPRKPKACLNQRHWGYVRRFHDRYGFIIAAAFDGDLFVHRDSVHASYQMDGQPSLREGQAVEFDIALDKRGRTVARNVTTSVLLRPWDCIGRRLQGVIRSFRLGWGFVNSDTFSGDLFVHRNSLLQQCQDAELKVGALVEFDVDFSYHKKLKSGKRMLEARQVVVIHPTMHTGAAHGFSADFHSTLLGHGMICMRHPNGVLTGNMYAACMGQSTSYPQQSSMYYQAADLPTYVYPYDSYAVQHGMMQPR